MEVMDIKTGAREEMVDITGAVRKIIRTNTWQSGAILLYCPHTTGAVTVNEGADPSVARDITVNMRTLVPRQGDYLHLEGNSDSHIKASMFGPEQMLIVENMDVLLGTWQKIFFCEFDGPRNRTLWIKWLPSPE